MMRSHITGKLPSDKQMALLEKIYSKAVEDGFYYRKT